VYEEVPGEPNRLKITFYVYQNGAKSYISLSDAMINLETSKVGRLKNDCGIMYSYLIEQLGTDTIDLNSASYKFGKYEVYIEFNGAKVSDVRDYTITNDSIKITNSGGEQFYHEG
jgi:hypothetical protein